jgi:hypothetical protein
LGQVFSPAGSIHRAAGIDLPVGGAEDTFTDEDRISTATNHVKEGEVIVQTQSNTMTFFFYDFGGDDQPNNTSRCELFGTAIVS